MVNRKALVTGAAKRLGREMALYLADQGFDVAVHYASSGADAMELAEQIRAKGAACETLQQWAALASAAACDNQLPQ